MPMIYESPDKGKTVYERDFGSSDRKLIKSEEFQLDPDKREWEYSDEGIKIWKIEAGKPSPTTYEK